MRRLVLDAMGVVFIHEDDVEELLIPFLQRRFEYLDVERLRDLYYHQVSLGKISSNEFFSILNVPDLAEEYLDECFEQQNEILLPSKSKLLPHHKQ